METGIDLILLNTTIEISSHLVDLLDLDVGDKIDISYINDGELLLPVIHKSDTGNKFTARNTVSFRGKKRDLFQTFGTKFKAEQRNGSVVLIGNGEEVFTSINKAAEDVKRKIDIKVLTDTNYNLRKFNTYII